MKKLFLSLLACGTIATAANAQKGSWLLYGQIGVHASSYDGVHSASSNAISWNVSPGVGYQFDNNWTLGLYASYLNQGAKPVGIGAAWIRTNDWEAGIFARYTNNLNKIFSYYTQFNAGFGHGNTTLDGKVITNSRYNGFALGITPAISANVHKGLALNFSIGGLGYSNYGYENVAGTNGHFNFTFGNQVNIGIQKNFGGHNRRIHREPGTDRHLKNWRDDDGDSPRRNANDDE